MPPVTILSPYSGRPVVVREQDLGRAIRDEQGRVFYVVEDEEHGRYASMTRKGSPKDLERYRDLQAGGPPASPESPDEPAATSSASQTPHDATGVQRRNGLGIVLLIAGVLLLAGAVYIAVERPGWLGLSKPAATDPADQPDPAPKDAPRSSLGPKTILASFGSDAKPLPRRSASAPQPAQQVFVPPAQMPQADPVPVIVAATPRRSPSFYVLSDKKPKYDDFRHTASGLRYKITHPTDGPIARAGNFVHVRYTAQTLDGKALIDDAQQSFVLMTGQAIRAFDEGLAGIRAGEQLRLLVPRGHSTTGTLPGIKRLPDQPILLDVQLVSVRPGVTHVVERPGQAKDTTAGPGDRVQVHYVATVEGREEVIDATRPRGEPMALTLGRGEVIPGLELGLTGMRLGETRLLTIPPYLAYGKRGAAGGLIPPDAVLSFRVTLVKIVRDKPKDKK